MDESLAAETRAFVMEVQHPERAARFTRAEILSAAKRFMTMHRYKPSAEALLAFMEAGG